MAGRVAGPTLNIPLGYESQQREIARRNELAQAMLSQGLRQDDNMVSPVQVLGHLAQAWAGRSMQKDADKQQSGLDDQIKADYTSRLQALAQAMQNPGQAGGTDPGITAAVDPMLAETPLGKLAITLLGDRKQQDQKYTTFGGQHVRQGDIPLGAYDNKPDSQVWVGQGGKAQLNPLIQTMTAIRSGQQVPGAYPVETTMPGAAPGQAAAAPGQAVATPPKAATAQAALQQLQSVGPQNFVAILKNNNFSVQVQTPQEALQFPSGTPIVLPDGTPGEVP